jgi:iron transport multicopper oxidase
MIDITSSVTYNTSAPLRNNGTVNEYHYVNDTALVPIMAVPQPKASKSFLLNFAFDTTTEGTNYAFVNNVTFNYPLVPAVFSELSLGSNATIQQAYGPLSFVLNHLEVFDIVIQNADTGAHPLYVSRSFFFLSFVLMSFFSCVFFFFFFQK